MKTAQEAGIPDRPEKAFMICRLPREKECRLFQPSNHASAVELTFAPFRGRSVKASLEEVEHWREIESDVVSLSDRTDAADDQSSYSKKLERLISGMQEQDDLDKVVLSRQYSIPFPENYSARQHFDRLLAAYADHAVYWIKWPEIGEWMGASPEPLLRLDGQLLSTVALAGTLAVDEGEWSEKEYREQRSVSDFIHQRLIDNGCLQVTSKGPYERRTGRLRHLQTDFEAWLPSKAEHQQVLEQLHPTPAVCGLPRQSALDWIDTLEEYDRQFYTGYWGLDEGGSAAYFVNLRCMSIHQTHLSFYAGGGVNALSGPQREWQETADKLQALMAYLDET